MAPWRARDFAENHPRRLSLAPLVGRERPGKYTGGRRDGPRSRDHKADTSDLWRVDHFAYGLDACPPRLLLVTVVVGSGSSERRNAPLRAGTTRSRS